MTTLHVRALSRRAGALLGAVAVLAAGCAAAGGGSGPGAGRAGAAQGAVAARASSRSFAHRTAQTTGPGSVRHSSAATITGPLPLFQCEHAMGHPVVSPVSAASRPRLGIPVSAGLLQTRDRSRGRAARGRGRTPPGRPAELN